jgi:hypothetical protein
MFDTPPEPPRPDPEAKLQHDIDFETVSTLRLKLPQFPAEPPEEFDRRLRMAATSANALSPRSGAEAALAASHVAALAHADLCYILVNQYPGDLRAGGQLRAQAASMGRESRGYFNALLRLQATRRKHGGTTEDHDATPWIDHCRLGLLTRALEELPPGPPVLPKPVAPPGKPLPPDPATLAATGGFIAGCEVPQTEEECHAARILGEADQYAVIHPLRSRLLRRLGRMPPECPFETPEPELLEAIIHGETANQEWADVMTPADALRYGGRDRIGWQYEAVTPEEAAAAEAAALGDA